MLAIQIEVSLKSRYFLLHSMRTLRTASMIVLAVSFSKFMHGVAHHATANALAHICTETRYII